MQYPGGIPLDAAEIAHWIYIFTNEERTKAGRYPLVNYPAITAIAQAHSANMARHGTAKNRLDGKNASARARAAGYNCTANIDGKTVSGLAENVIKHSRTEHYKNSKEAARALVDIWMNRQTRANILRDRYRRTGIGVTIDVSVKDGRFLETIYAVQDFSSCR